jgi:hypothetical protein
MWIFFKIFLNMDFFSDFFKNFPLKINQDRVANNGFHEDQLSFPVYGEKLNLGHFRPFLPH